MIVGDGMMASAFEHYADDDSVLIFASGVSDSTEKKKTAFRRELRLLLRSIHGNPKKLFVYFSSMDASRPVGNKYFDHKLLMESVISAFCDNYIILRLPNIVGFKGNPSNLVNFFKKKVLDNKSIDVHGHATRSILDVEDVRLVADTLIRDGERGMFRFGGVEMISAKALAEMISWLFYRVTKINVVDDGYYCDMRNSKPVQKIIYDKIDNNDYTLRTLKKYLIENRYTYWCQKCEDYHKGTIGVCPMCGTKSSNEAMYITYDRAVFITGSFPTEEEFVRRNLLVTAGAFFKEKNNEELLRLYYRGLKRVL